jgi:hypothetical protein
MNELRQYEPWECGGDGYPFAWHGRCTCDHLDAVNDDMCVYSVCSADAPAIKDAIRAEAHERCERCLHPYAKGLGEWSVCDERCRHGGPLRVVEEEDGFPTRIYECPPRQDIAGLRFGGLSPVAHVEARYRILTVHHLDEDKANCRWWNLVSLCQRCHLLMQRKVVMGRPYHYEHSEWFKPYAAAFYAFKYLGEDLARPEVMARQDDLLALEYQGTQEALL